MVCVEWRVRACTSAEGVKRNILSRFCGYNDRIRLHWPAWAKATTTVCAGAIVHQHTQTQPFFKAWIDSLQQKALPFERIRRWLFWLEEMQEGALEMSEAGSEVICICWIWRDASRIQIIKTFFLNVVVSVISKRSFWSGCFFFFINAVLYLFIGIGVIPSKNRANTADTNIDAFNL